MPQTLRQYSLLADGERGAIIGPDGGVVWMCFPAWDSPAVFTSLIGGRGFYRVSPVDRFVWGGYYEEGTLIWRSRWATTNAILECREALAFPADREGATLLRRIIAVEGDGKFDVVLHPSSDYGSRRAADICRHDDGTWTARTGAIPLRWTGANEASVVDDGTDAARWECTLALREGEHHDLVLEFGRSATGRPDSADALWESTQRHWEAAVPPLPDLDARRDTRRSYAVLRGLTSAGGGMVAAATMSLPERAEAGRNYDYRYVWIRDQCFAGVAAATAGTHPLLDSAVRFVGERLLADGTAMAPAYTTDGGRIPDQRSLSLPGYPGGYDIVGNHVNGQFQLDAFGQSLLLFATAARHDRLEGDGWRAAEIAVDAIATRRFEVDAGIWELAPKHWAHSRLECVAGLRAISSVTGLDRGRRSKWALLADQVLAEVSSACVHPSGRWQRAPDDDRVDAALLLATVHGAAPPDDPRSVATHEAVRAGLARDGYLYRFRHDERPLDAAEGAFLLCGFWMSLSCVARGEIVDATRWFERNRAACGSPGLYSEEFDVGERQLRGNLPQAFVHAGMLECAARLSSG